MNQTEAELRSFFRSMHSNWLSMKQIVDANPNIGKNSVRNWVKKFRYHNELDKKIVNHIDIYRWSGG